MILRILTEWKPLSKTGLFAGVTAALLFCMYALSHSGEFLFPDYANLPFHEFGHLFFGLAGERIAAWGGTLMQLIIPFVIMLNFFIRRDPGGVFFCAFWFGENLLNIAVYINDARSMLLPLVGGGEHDWNIILGQLNLLEQDHYIAAAVNASGWFIMLASIVWFLVIGMKSRQES